MTREFLLSDYRRNESLQARHEMELFTVKFYQVEKDAYEYLQLMRKKALQCARAVAKTQEESIQ